MIRDVTAYSSSFSIILSYCRSRGGLFLRGGGIFPFFGRELFHVVVDAVRYALNHSLLHVVVLHAAVFAGIGHVAHLEDRRGDLTPVDAAHGVRLPYVLAVDAGFIYVGIQDVFGKGAGLVVDVPVVGIARGLADGHGACDTGIGGSVGVEPDKHVRIGFIGDLGALGIADVDFVGVTDHDDLVTALQELIPQLEADVEGELILRYAGGCAAGAAADFDLGLGGAWADRLLFCVGILLVARVDDDEAFVVRDLSGGCGCGSG